MILIGIGANIVRPDGATPEQACAEAVAAMAEIPGLDFVAVSPWYRTTPISQIPQPDYCNGVLRMRGSPEPLPLLQALQRLEAASGRRPGARDSPRTLDLDIIDLNGVVRAVPPLILPHPRAHLRAFVLRPLMDVAPDWQHPVLRQNVASLLENLPPQGVRPWGD